MSSIKNISPASIQYKSVTWQSSANIGIIKYWGKTGVQLPLNPSISYTLEKCNSTITVDYHERINRTDECYSFLMDGKTGTTFDLQLKPFFKYAFERYPALRRFIFDISAFNSYPVVAGVYSSASIMSALALCLLQINEYISGVNRLIQFDEAGSLSRMGSGMACRSIRRGWMLWGQYDYMPYSNDDYAISIEDQVHDIFHHLCDSILVIDSKSELDGRSFWNQLPASHFYGKARVEQSKDNIALLLEALHDGNFNLFAQICEEEALSLHALLMSSRPGLIYFHPNTIAAIKLIRKYRDEYHVPVCFTMNISANVHVLYPSEYKSQLEDTLLKELRMLCENQQIIDDRIGGGPHEIVDSSVQELKLLVVNQ